MFKSRRAHHFFSFYLSLCSSLLFYNFIRKTNKPSHGFSNIRERRLRDISETTSKVPRRKPDSVVASTLLQANRGILLIVLDLVLSFRYGSIRIIPVGIIPGLDIIFLPPPLIYFLIGVIDLFMMNLIWEKNLNGWRYGIIMSIVILFIVPFFLTFFISIYISFLYVIIDLFAVVELAALITKDAREFYGV